MSNFGPDLNDPFVARAVVLRETFHTDAVARDKAGGRPGEQIRLLKESGLLSAGIPTAYGGGGASWLSLLRVVREFARTDGSLAHLFGYHHLPVHAVQARSTPAQQERWLRAAAKAQWLWSNSGNALSKTSSAQRAPGNDGWLVTGFRPFSSGSHVADVIQLAWENALGQRLMGVVPADRAGIVIEDDWDGIGQRQTGSGRVTYQGVRVHESEVLGQPVPLNPTGAPAEPYRTVTPLQQQSVLLNVFIGTAQGALRAGREYTVHQSRPWIHSGVERHVDDPWVRRQYGELWVKTQAATALADRALLALDSVIARGEALSAEERGEAAVAIAAANVLAGEVALQVSSEIFEVTGARSAVRKTGLDRFWRNVRIHTLHNPSEYKTRNVGRWVLGEGHPEPGTYQ